NIVSGSAGYRYDQYAPGPSAVTEMMKDKAEMSQPTYVGPAVAEIMQKANHQAAAFAPNPQSVVEMARSKVETHRSP
ncbi:hypothetical protein NL478_28210, partial [Klebsiella pneumoniae]|nr:hypothetical protein [Klebsiella pneumoniae]